MQEVHFRQVFHASSSVFAFGSNLVGAQCVRMRILRLPFGASERDTNVANAIRSPGEGTFRLGKFIVSIYILCTEDDIFGEELLVTQEVDREETVTFR